MIDKTGSLVERGGLKVYRLVFKITDYLGKGGERRIFDNMSGDFAKLSVTFKPNHLSLGELPPSI